MALIDKDITAPKSNEETNKKTECQICKKELQKDSVILLCENCFNQSVTESISKVKQILGKIDEELQKVNTAIESINKEIKMNKDKMHLIVLNKLEIDLLNFESIKKKLMIDKESNEKALILNQEQANKLRKQMNWALFDIKK